MNDIKGKSKGRASFTEIASFPMGVNKDFVVSLNKEGNAVFAQRVIFDNNGQKQELFLKGSQIVEQQYFEDMKVAFKKIIENI